MSFLSDLYQEVILDHNRRPRNFGELIDANGVAGVFDPDVLYAASYQRRRHDSQNQQAKQHHPTELDPALRALSPRDHRGGDREESFPPRAAAGRRGRCPVRAGHPLHLE